MGMLKEEYLPHYNYADYCQWEGNWELIYGQAYAMSPSPTFEHQEIALAIASELRSILKNCKNCKVVTEVDWKIQDDIVLRPDISLLCNIENRGKFIHQAPNIIFEILSPSTQKQDKHLKYAIYEEQLVDYYVIVEPHTKTAYIHKLYDKSYQLESNFRDDKYNFLLDNCEIELDFSNIFEN
ncbi:MAG: Uma2 family endonuclease [Epsilonproteobacteria bacterium]|nr:Uma2 family endonuclease [Campylobacterota bacterium]